MAAVIPLGALLPIQDVPVPAKANERFVRVCPRHFVPLREHVVETPHGRLDVLTCPGPVRPRRPVGRPRGSHRIHEASVERETAPHRVGAWVTLDTERNAVYGAGTPDRSIIYEGALGEILLRAIDEGDLLESKEPPRGIRAAKRSATMSAEAIR